MKRTISILMTFFIGLSIMGCGGTNGEYQPNSDITASAITTEDESSNIISVETVEDITADDTPNTESEVNIMEKKDAAYAEILAFMMEEYGFSEEELTEYDLIRLMDDYDFRDTDYSADEVREILDDQGEYYKRTGYTELFYFLDTDEGGRLTVGCEINRIGFLYNEGTLIRKVVYDIKEQKIYDNSVDAMDMTDEQAQALKNLAADYNIYGWDNYYGGDESETTGSLGWKLVFECSDGSECVYGGYTQDMTHLPDRFSDITESLLGMTGK